MCNPGSFPVARCDGGRNPGSFHPGSFQPRDVTWDALPTGLPGPLNDAVRMAKQILDKGRLELEEVEGVLKLTPLL